MGKLVMFMGWVWLIISIVAGVTTGGVTVATTVLTANISDTATTIPVTTTNGFTSPGFIIIDDERIAYSHTTSTAFDGNVAQPVQRGANSTTAAAHTAGARVRTVESSMINNSVAYNLAILSVAGGLSFFIAAPTAIFSLIISLITLPLAFLGTDLEILTYIWGVVSLGLIVALLVTLVGGRRSV